MKLHVAVTQDHIDKAIRSSCCSCPVAFAFRSPHDQTNYPKVEMASVHKEEAYLICINENGSRCTVRVELPEVVQDFIGSRDKRAEIRPFAFDCEANLYFNGTTRLIFPTIAEKEAAEAA